MGGIIIRKTCALLLVCAVSGGHWMIMQGIAWSAMVTDYSRGSTIWQGVKKTFGGDYPCDLCRAISEAKQQETSDARDEGTPPNEHTRLMATLAEALIATHPAAKKGPCPLDETCPENRSDPPPVPPPRSTPLHA